MKLKKKILSIVIAVAMVIVMTPLMAFAEEETHTYNLVLTMENGSTMQNQRVVEDAFRNSLGDKVVSVGAMNMNGTFWVDLKTNTAITYADVQGENGAFSKVHSTPGIEPAGTVLGYGRMDDPTKYASQGEFDAERNSTELLPENTRITFYTLVEQTVNFINLEVDAPVCGTKVEKADQGGVTEYATVTLSEDAKKYYHVYMMKFGDNEYPSAVWANAGFTSQADATAFYGTMKGDTEYGVVIGLEPNFGVAFGDNFSPEYAKVNGENAVFVEAEKHFVNVGAKVTAYHEWGTARVTKKPTLTAKGVKTITCKHCTATKTEEIAKLKANTLNVKGLTATVKYKKVKKAAQQVALSKVIKLTDAGQGTKTYAKVSGNKKITIAKSGKVTVKKKLKKGTYKVKVKVTAAGNATYGAVTKTVTFKIKVK